MSLNVAVLQPFCKESDPQWVSREAEAAYASIVGDVERERGVGLPNLKNVRFTLDMPA